MRYDTAPSVWTDFNESFVYSRTPQNDEDQCRHYCCGGVVKNDVVERETQRNREREREGASILYLSFGVSAPTFDTEAIPVGIGPAPPVVCYLVLPPVLRSLTARVGTLIFVSPRLYVLCGLPTGTNHF